jgi:hypothetical protein
MRNIREPIEQVAERARSRSAWWAEPSAAGDGLYLVRSDDGVIAEGLTQRQAMTIASEYNLARDDAQTLARRQANGHLKSA